ncbi:ATP-binding protein [Methylobacterium sp. Leaf106]|uniref:ATP-binding protein n=1 Tax=Methylobacterium sp. Leaf106 TaxID=1736255 RepID=UPI0006FF31BC|nr:ATP-binding protein [Methylobacterium sp. Leaf106]KQP52819.1 hypothetical protein ASF34_00035 [Methylobacterium sp. Leaf106]
MTSTFDQEIDLDPAAVVRASLPEEARRRSELMEKVRHVYLRTDRDTLLAKHFDRLLEDLTERRDPDAHEDADGFAERLEGNIVVVLGPSGAGKTSAVRRLLSKHARVPNYGKKGVRCPVITVRVPSPCSVGELGRVVLRATGYPLRRTRVPSPEIWGTVRERIQSLGILVLHLDEFQDAHVTLRADEQVKLRHLLRSLLVDEDYPIGLIISGQPEFEDFLRPDRSSVRRGSWQMFERIALTKDREAIRTALKELPRIACLGIKEAAVLAILPRLVHAGCNLLGITIEEIHNAIRWALEAKANELTIEHFEAAYAFRTGCLAPWNPYVAADYRDIDCTRVLARSEPLPPPDGNKSKGKKGSKA